MKFYSRRMSFPSIAVEGKWILAASLNRSTASAHQKMKEESSYAYSDPRSIGFKLSIPPLCQNQKQFSGTPPGCLSPLEDIVYLRASQGVFSTIQYFLITFSSQSSLSFLSRRPEESKRETRANSPTRPMAT